MRFIRGFGQFWYDFLIGDDWKIAAAVVITLALATVALLGLGPDEEVFTAAVGVALMLAFAISIRVDVGPKD